jgi:hypothetical protein
VSQRNRPRLRRIDLFSLAILRRLPATIIFAEGWIRA